MIDKPNDFEALVQFEVNESVAIVIDKSKTSVFAYWSQPDGLNGHVWLFNIGGSNQTQVAEMPGPNPVENCRPHHIIEPISEEDFEFYANPENPTVGIYFRGKLAAILWEGAQPGKSAYAETDSCHALAMNVKPPIIGAS